MAPLFGAGAPEAWLLQGQPSSLELRRGQTDKGAMKGDHRVSRRQRGEQGQNKILKHGGFCLAVTGMLGHAFHRYVRDLGPFKSGSFRTLTL